ncbi:PIG-L family deacetylase [Shimazuella sp. AN120528]|uniref:PIG-L family deacetylase n=1 Tax=Shimazuella soli TaxID=1892854 RepID=UPI001F0D4543|nr:PIG-L family deacetylase [Shimazuella soli]MCH5586235.1 PIG-L family deacetylase [Shimazuella soli]
MRKLHLFLFIVICCCLLSFSLFSAPSASAISKQSSPIPSNKWKITGTVKGTGDVSKKFTIRPSNLQSLKMGEDLKFEIHSQDKSLVYTLNIPVKKDVKEAVLYRYESSGEEAGYFRVENQSYDAKKNKILAEVNGGGNFIVVTQPKTLKDPDTLAPKTSLISPKIASTPPAIFFIPHQDDETLSMGVAITQHLDAGREVIAVLYTDGAGSIAQKILNGEASSSWWGGTHNPVTEGYGHIDNQRFSDARTHELKSALMQLGVKPENIHIRNLTSDGTLTLDEMKSLVMEYAQKYPGASFKAMSQHDSSLSHSISGQALVDLYNQKAITDVRLYVSRNDWNRVTVGSTITPNTSQAFRVKKAAFVYQAWNPMADSFAIGYHSVSPQFNSMLANIQNRQHLPTQ